MPPSRRTRKNQVGLKRIDAALDALRPMGFSDNLVRKTLRQLLKAYGGDEGWTFIEEASYRILIDAILEGLGENSQENIEQKASIESNSSQKDNEVKDTASEIQAESSPVQAMKMNTLSLDMTEDNDSSREKYGVQIHPAQASSSQIDSQPSRGFISCCMDGRSSQDKPGKEIQYFSPEISSSGSCPLPIYALPPADSLSSRKRKPCYGWLSSDDDEEDGVLLTPAGAATCIKRDN